MAQITYANKSAINENAGVAATNKVQAADMNEIKDVVNTNDTNVGDINNLTTTNKSSVVSAINEINARAEEYSTTETATNAKWINGKTIYRKVIDFGSLPNATTKSVGHDISNLETMITLRGIAYSSNESLPIPFSHVSSMAAQVQIYVSGSNIIIATGSDRSSQSAYVILEYTKISN